ncbi:MAG: hypothetical protein ACO4CT_06605 [Planctomycetota bacterium]
MSAARRRKTSARPNTKVSSTPASGADDLPELEPLEEELDVLEPVDDELPELEPIEDDSPVKVSHGASDEEGFGVRVDVTVPDMDKKAVLDAVGGPLQRFAARDGDALRFREVVVVFGGEAMIGSAVKNLVEETLAPCRPRKLVVRRGFGDELLHEGELPKAALEARRDGGRTTISIDDTQCAPKDVPFAIEGALAAAAAQATEQHIEVSFASGAAPHRTTVAALEGAFSNAKSLRIDGDVRFDRELEARVVAESSDGTTTIHVDTSADAATIDAALDLVLPGLARTLAGRDIALQATAHALTEAQVTRLVGAATTAGAAVVRMVRRDDEDDVLVPALLRAAAAEDGSRAALQVQPGGRGESAVIAAFRREVGAHRDLLRGREVTVDWPAGYALSPVLETACLGDLLLAQGPKSIACSFGGADREPFFPAPVQIDEASSPAVVCIDTEAGKPVEVLRAIERRVAPWAAVGSRGKDVRVEFQGQGTVSRSMTRRVLEMFEQGGASRLEAVQDGVSDVILPPLLKSESAGGEVTLTPAAAGRTPEQVDAALAREIDAADWPANGAFKITEPDDLADRLAALLAARGAARVVVGTTEPVQVHPSLFGPLEADGQQLKLHACPGPDEEAVRAQIEREVPMLLAAREDLATHDVTLVWPHGRKGDPLVQATLAAIQAAGPGRVLLEGTGRARQVFPEIRLDYVSVLGRRDAEEAPLILLGIDVCPEDEDTDAHLARVLEKLGLVDVDGRRVLLIGRDEGRDLAVDPADALFGAVCTAAQERAAATLVFRGADRHGRPHFEVQGSKLEALPVGTRVGDPRPSARS